MQFDKSRTSEGKEEVPEEGHCPIPPPLLLRQLRNEQLTKVAPTPLNLIPPPTSVSASPTDSQYKNAEFTIEEGGESVEDVKIAAPKHTAPPPADDLHPEKVLSVIVIVPIKI
jgi:hypothetical protein